MRRHDTRNAFLGFVSFIRGGRLDPTRHTLNYNAVLLPPFIFQIWRNPDSMTISVISRQRDDRAEIKAEYVPPCDPPSANGNSSCSASLLYTDLMKMPWTLGQLLIRVAGYETCYLLTFLFESLPLHTRTLLSRFLEVVLLRRFSDMLRLSYRTYGANGTLMREGSGQLSLFAMALEGSL